MGSSAWLISMAALHPSIAVLEVAIVGVRFFGIARAVFRYLERLVSHNVTFRLLGRLRTWFYERLEPLAPARLMQYQAGDLLARVIGDISTLENFLYTGRRAAGDGARDLHCGRRYLLARVTSGWPLC